MQSPVLWTEKSLASVQTREQPARLQLYRKNMQVLVESKLNMNEQSTLTTMKPNSILHWINKSLARRLKNMIVFLYLALIRPHLEYCNPFEAQQSMKNYKLE